MSSLIVRNVDESIIQALKQRAARHGRSAEAEHRVLLQQALIEPASRPLAEVLAAMPAIGLDEDFARAPQPICRLNTARCHPSRTLPECQL